MKLLEMDAVDLIFVSSIILIVLMAFATGYKFGKAEAGTGKKWWSL